MLLLLDVVSKYGCGHVYTKFCACVCVRAESRVHASSAALLSPAEPAIRTVQTRLVTGFGESKLAVCEDNLLSAEKWRALRTDAKYNTFTGALCSRSSR
jgi:hypothetical protein